MTHTRATSGLSKGMTILELMLVVAILAILAAIGFGVSKGFNKSTANSTAMGQISAALGVARSQAMANQRVTGILFYIPSSPLVDTGGKTYAPLTTTMRSSGKISIAIVYATEVKGILNMEGVIPSKSGDPKQPFIPPEPEVLLDLADMDPISLPDNIGVQTLISTLPDYHYLTYNEGFSRYQDEFLGFNRMSLGGGSLLSSPIGGVILFDPTGQLVQLRYAFRMKYTNLKDPTQFIPSQAFTTFFAGAQAEDPKLALKDAMSFVLVHSLDSSMPKGKSPVSSPALTLYDWSEFKSRGFDDDDPILRQDSKLGKDTNISQVMITRECYTEEAWLEKNGIPCMISRYSGALQKVK